MMTADERRYYTALQVASGVVVTKQLAVRPVPPSGLRPGLQPSSLADLSALISSQADSPFTRVVRRAAAALLYSADKRTPAPAMSVLRGRQEQVALDNLHQARAPHLEIDRSCSHCQVLRRTSDHPGVPPIIPVRHQAHIKSELDPVTQVATVAVDDFLVLVPEKIARKFLALAHPLHWAEATGSIFQTVTAVSRSGEPLEPWSDPEHVQQHWEAAAQDEAFLFERVDWPINDAVAASAENIISIRGFSRSDAYAPPGLRLAYRYQLERSIRSNLGVTWEPAGLSVDQGCLKVEVFDLKDLPADIQMDRRDVLELMAQVNPDPDASARLCERLFTGRLDDAATPDRFAAITDAGLRIDEQWQDVAGPVRLMRMSATKGMHFTLPENGPVEMWQLSIALAPQMLFNFMNLAICLAPRILMDELIAGKWK